MNAAQLINQTSGDVEYYTPRVIIEAARVTLGGSIDLDPASSVAANGAVMARNFYTREDDGLQKMWICETLWMNHPFSRKGNPLWINKLIEEFRLGNVGEACCITFAATSEEWFQPLLRFPMCFLSPRTNYRLPDGTTKRGVSKGSVVTYLGFNVDGFNDAFKGMGQVKL